MELKKLQQIELDILKKIINVCEKNNIEYFLIGGSLIGTIRHKGFIPWDDDIDIGMTRENFDKFNSLSKEFKMPLFLQTFLTDENYPLTMTKILNTDVNLKEERIHNPNSKFGAYIDIFPFDQMPNNSIARTTQLYHYKLLNFQIESRLKWRAFSGREAILSKGLKILPISTSKLVEKRSNLLRKYQLTQYDYYNLSSQYGIDHEKIENNQIHDLIKMPFEDIMVSIPRSYDVILRRQYGNYMKLPDETSRIAKHLDL